MDKENCLVKVQNEDGKTFDMLILKEFDYNNKKYAVLTEIDACCCGDDCHCDDNCDCDESCDCGCQDGKECSCDEHSNCDGNCHCDDDCDCDESCDCGCQDGKECSCDEHSNCDGNCHCDDEPMLCLLEIIKDKDGNEMFKSIDDEKLFNELVEEADKILYED